MVSESSIGEDMALTSAVEAYFLGDFRPLVDLLPNLGHDPDAYYIQLGRLRIVAKYETMGMFKLPEVDIEAVPTHAKPLFVIADALGDMDECKTGECVRLLNELIDEQASKLLSHNATVLDGKVVRIQMLRYLPPYVGGSRERALKACDQLSEPPGSPKIADYFRTLIGAEIELADG